MIMHLDTGELFRSLQAYSRFCKYVKGFVFFLSFFVTCRAHFEIFPQPGSYLCDPETFQMNY